VRSSVDRSAAAEWAAVGASPTASIGYAALFDWLRGDHGCV